MTSWKSADLNRFGDAQEVRIAGTRRDGSPQLRGQISVGALTADVDFVDAAGDADDEIDAAYQAKYGRYPGLSGPSPAMRLARRH